MATPLDNAIILIALFFAISFGLIFKAMLSYQINRWNDNRQTQTAIEYQKPQIKIAYFATSIFTYGCVAKSLGALGFFDTLAYGTAAVVVIPTAILIWIQLGSMLSLLVKGGSAAIDIDQQ